MEVVPHTFQPYVPVRYGKTNSLQYTNKTVKIYLNLKQNLFYFYQKNTLKKLHKAQMNCRTVVFDWIRLYRCL